MNKLVVTLTSFVGAKQLTFAIGFSGVAIFLLLPSRHKPANWSGVLAEADRSLPSEGSGKVNLEAPDAASPGSALSASEADVTGSESDVSLLHEATALAVGSGSSEFARQIDRSSSQDFGHSTGDDRAALIFGSKLGGPIGAPAHRAAGSFSGSRATGSAGASVNANSGGGATDSAIGRARDSSQTSSSEAARADSEVTPESEIVPDPSPVIPSAIPIASSPVPGPQSSPTGPLGNNAEGSAQSAGGVASLELNSDTTGPSLPGLTDLPAETDPNGGTLVTAEHVADSGQSFLLLGGAVLGVLGFHRRQSRSLRGPHD